MKHKILYTILALILYGCAPAIHTSVSDSQRKALSENAEVLVLTPSQNQPDNCKLLGTISIRDNGFSVNCNYTQVINDAKKEARKAGGNMLKLTEIKTPDGFSSCYRIKANIFYSKNPDSLMAKSNAQEDSITKSKFPSNPNYAILYVYRPKNGEGFLVGYNLHIHDSIICRAKNNSNYEIKLYKEGKTIIWAETEARESVTIDVKFGEEYFLKCGIRMGVLVGEPELNLVYKQQGRNEFSRTASEK